LNNDVKTYGAVLLAMVLWGFSFVSTKIILTSFPVFTYIAIRFSLASVVFLLLLKKRGFPKLGKKTHFRLVLIAAFEPFLYFIFESLGLSITTASKASLLIAVIPMVVLIFARIMIGEKITPKNLTGIILSFGGIFLLVSGGEDFSWSFGESGGTFLGDLLIMGSVVTASLYIVLTRELTQRVSSFHITAFQVLYATLFFLPLIFIDVFTMDWRGISYQSLGGLMFNVFGSTIGAFLLYNFALTKLSASRSSLFINGIPIVTAAAAWFILGERLTLVQFAGGALVILSVTLTNVSRRNVEPLAPS